MTAIPTSQRIQNLIDFIQGLPHSDGAGKLSSNSLELVGSPLGDKFYLTTAINYTNGLPHIGHGYEAITSDIICRYHRIYGRNVFFLTGTDEHGQKVATTALKNGYKNPKNFCDKNVLVFRELNRELNISSDYYIRTTDSDHYKLAQEMFIRAYNNGDIYLSNYSGWYNIREEHFVPLSEAMKNNYIDPISGESYEKHHEEAYFFKMSKYQNKLISHIKSNPRFIKPLSKYNDILSRLNEPLEDLCVSRTSFDWGVPVPDIILSKDNVKKKHVLYVWFDALTNYLTGIDYLNLNNNPKSLNYRKNKDNNYWPVDVHIIGKDIVWFHTVIWPCILLSCNIPLATCTFCHGFVNDKNGEKMSKSLGNVIDPFELLNKHNYKADSIRYFIAHQAPFGNDLRFNIDEFEYIHDSCLTKTYGNLVNRVLTLINKYCNGKIPDIKPYNINKYGLDLNKFRNKIELLMYNFELKEYTDLLHHQFELCNKWIVENAPWDKKKNLSSSQKSRVLRTMIECIYVYTHFQYPLTPNACEKVFKYIGQSSRKISDLNPNFENLKPFTKVLRGELLFEQYISKHETKQLNAIKPDIACVEFVVGKILQVSLHPNADKCFISKIDIGESKPRQIVSGLVNFIKKEELNNSLVIIFKNLKKGKIRGELSEGMLLAASNNDKSIVSPLRPPKNSKIGERLLWTKDDITQWKPDGNINIRKKNSVWLNISPKLKTNNQGQMCFDGQTLVTSAGTVLSDLKDAQIS